MEFLFFIIGVSVGAVVIWFFLKNKYERTKGVPQAEVNKLLEQINTLNVDKSRAEEKSTQYEKSLVESKNELTQTRNKVLNLQTDLAISQTEHANLQQRLEEQKIQVEELQKKFIHEFENLANRIFEDKSQKFTEQNKNNLDEILKPLNEKIKDFQKKVEDTHVEESKLRFSLKTEIERLYNLNQQLSKDAINLTNAIKGESKTQGNWGEMILESILEKSGLVRDREFVVQASIQSTEGKRQQPDVIINLPEKKNMIIDAKVSLTAYERYYSTEDENQRSVEMKEHITSIRKHIKELSLKNYPNLYQINTPDFVLMFIPIEPAFSVAVQSDANLFYDAFEKNVVIVSPSTLLATLRTIASIWRLEKQNKNAMEIAKLGGDLYDKFVGFVDDLIKLGNQMKTTQATYEDAMNKLHRGRGNLVKKAQEIKELGAKTSKTIPQTLLDRAETDSEPELKLTE